MPNLADLTPAEIQQYFEKDAVPFALKSLSIQDLNAGTLLRLHGADEKMILLQVLKPETFQIYIVEAAPPERLPGLYLRTESTLFGIHIGEIYHLLNENVPHFEIKVTAIEVFNV